MNSTIAFLLVFIVLSLNAIAEPVKTIASFTQNPTHTETREIGNWQPPSGLQQIPI